MMKPQRRISDEAQAPERVPEVITLALNPRERRLVEQVNLEIRAGQERLAVALQALTAAHGIEGTLSYLGLDEEGLRFQRLDGGVASPAGNGHIPASTPAAPAAEEGA